MKRTTNIFSQILGVAIQVLNQFGGFIPQKYQTPIAVGIGIAQAVVGTIASNYNPDGTPAAVAYVPPANRNTDPVR